MSTRRHPPKGTDRRRREPPAPAVRSGRLPPRSTDAAIRPAPVWSGFGAQSDQGLTWLADTVEVPAGRPLCLAQVLSRRYHLPAETFAPIILLRRSLDARQHRPPTWVVRCRFGLTLPAAQRAEFLLKHKELQLYLPPPPIVTTRGLEPTNGPVVVVGTGPAGMMAANLLAHHGFAVVVLEQGAPLADRVTAVERFWRDATLDLQANVQVGEGGAGTFSDGKLTSRTKEGDWQDRVLELLYAHGAPDAVRWDHRPHVGTDLIRQVTARLNADTCAHGGSIRYYHRVIGLRRQQRQITHLVVETPQGREDLPVGLVVLAPGNAARPLFAQLLADGVPLERKPFAIGVRLEHPQRLVDRWFLGRHAEITELTPMNYQLSHRTAQGKAVYSFCMCPGGEIINAADATDGVVVNGMSQHARASGWANAAYVVQIMPEDLPGTDPLAGLAWQHALEREAARMGGGDLTPPAQTLADFIAGTVTTNTVRSSVRPRVRPAPVHELFPGPIREALAEAFVAFDRRLPGFIDQANAAVGIESRTSCPVRCRRGSDGVVEGTANLYMVGEGSGHAGGITTSAIDGMKTAVAIVTRYRPG